MFKDLLKSSFKSAITSSEKKNSSSSHSAINLTSYQPALMNESNHSLSDPSSLHPLYVHKEDTSPHLKDDSSSSNLNK